MRCTLLIGRSNYHPVWQDALRNFPATVIWTDPLPVVQLNEIAQQYPGMLLPPGFAHPGFKRALINRILHNPPSQQSEPWPPARAWMPVVSGTLLSALEQAWPETEFHGVCVARNHDYKGSATLHMASEKFSKPALNPPPYPSCPFSDAKVWQFTTRLGKQNDLIWNTNP
jgi:hypothetical protein